MAFLCSCKIYKQDILFRLDDEFGQSQLSLAVDQAEKNYVIQVNDQLSMEVFTNKGERIVDPNNELNTGGRMGGQQQSNNNIYLVMVDSTAKFPIINQVKLAGLTINQAETLLQRLYNEYYKETFVRIRFQNKRVVVLGAMGGQVVPLENENMSLLEIIAMAGGIRFGAKSQNIKLIRGDYNAPEVYEVNLNTVSGMRNSMLDVEPGDVIYVEPWRRPVYEGIRDITPLMGIITSTLALILVIQNSVSSQ